MKTNDLVQRVLDKVDDPSVTAEEVVDLFNFALYKAALLTKLPALDASATVDTVPGSASVALPSNYLHSVYWIGSASQEIRIGRDYYDLGRFLKAYPDPALAEVGDVRRAAIKGNNLFYQPSPASADTLTLYFFGKPTTLALGDDGPTCLPEPFQAAILCNYALRDLYARIEEGIEGGKVDTMYHESLYSRGMADLVALYPREEFEPSEIPDDRSTSDFEDICL